MDLGWLSGLLGFAFAMAVTPGPNNTIVTASGSTHGMARTLPLAGGIASGVAAIMLVAAAFGTSVAGDTRVGAALKWIGVAYLLWLAWKIASAEPSPLPAGVTAEDGASRAEVRDGRTVGAAPLSFAQGAALQFVNPKLWVMVSGAVVTYGQVSGASGHLTIAIVFALVFGAMTFLGTLVWAALGASVGRILTSRRALRRFNAVMAAFLLLSLIPIVFE
ncbi:LysE family translocator [Acuticoccus sediminis]|uniref:LysE family translocator n=1 Tax=Acuticoccus sediminis TaxID=2184697 RepID=UPI001CFDFDE1|nr:LysE family translocator [Acuticoccus sediminis]